MISVIIPVYNGEKYLVRCLSSLVKQTLKDFELIIIDDGSTDNSLVIINSFCDYFKYFKIISKKNEGQAVARNVGIEVASNEFLCFLDCDDEVKEDYLDEFHYMIQKNTKLDLGVSQIKRVFEYNPSFIERRFKYIQSVYLDYNTKIMDDKWLITKIMNAPYAKIIRREFILKNKIKFNEGKLYEDFLFTTSLLLSNPRVSFSHKDTYIYYVHKNSSMTTYNNKIYDIFSVFDEIIRFAKNKNVYDIYFSELEYLSYYHIAIGTMYRLCKYKPLLFLKYRNECLSWLKKQGFTNRNIYIKNFSLFVRFYLKMFFLNNI